MSTFKSQDDNPYSFKVKLDKGENFRLEQDVQGYIDYAAESREITAYANGRMVQFKPLCIVPDIVALDFLIKTGIDIHAPDFMHDEDKKRKLMDHIRLEAPKLLLSNVKRI